MFRSCRHDFRAGDSCKAARILIFVHGEDFQSREGTRNDGWNEMAQLRRQVMAEPIGDTEQIRGYPLSREEIEVGEPRSWWNFEGCLGSSLYDGVQCCKIISGK